MLRVTQSTPAVSSQPRRDQLMAAISLTTGEGGSIDYRRAAEILEQLVTENQPDFVHCDALGRLGLVYGVGGHGLLKNEAAAIDFYLSAADSGSVAAMHASGRIYWSGVLGMTKNTTEAEKYLVRAIASADKVQTRSDIPAPYKSYISNIRDMAKEDLGNLRLGRNFITGVKIVSGVLTAVTAAFKFATWLDERGNGGNA